MHDPMTVAFSIKSPFKKTTQFGVYRKTLVTIWHVDPESDGTDDSCGWFVRARHGDKILRDKIRKEFIFERQYWFDKEGKQIYSTSGTMLNMFRVVLWQFFKNHKKSDAFLTKNLSEILFFSENPYDCGGDKITGKFGYKPNDETMESMADMVFSWVLRKLRPWYCHPKWHIHHWKVQIHWPALFRKKIPLGNCDHNLRETI